VADDTAASAPMRLSKEGKSRATFADYWAEALKGQRGDRVSKGSIDFGSRS
jgi:hypothetical protein